MAIRRLESFDHFSTADAAKKGITVSGASSVSAGTGRNGTNSFRTVNNSPINTIAIPNVSGSEGLVALAFRLPSLPGSATHRTFAVTEGGRTHLFLEVHPSGFVRVCRQNSSFSLGQSVAGVIKAATWHWVELAFTIANSPGGSFEVRVDGSTVLNVSGVDTQDSGTGTFGGVVFGGGESPTTFTCDYDDLCVADDKTFRGDHRIIALVPSAGNGDLTAWTPSTGTDHGVLVNAIPPDIGTYVSAAAPGATDTYTFPALGVTGDIAAVQVSHYARADIAGVRALSHVERIGGTNYPTAPQLLGGDWSYYTWMMENSPATTSPWSVAEIDAAERGPKIAA